MLRYAFTIFLSAFLLFLVQPLIGKFILPWFGGGPGVWTTCMVLFQVLLLIGYAYAHLLNHLFSARVQMIVHVVLLAGALAFLPIVPDVSWKPVEAGAPAMRILLLLIVTIGLPFAVLSATGPLLQAWFSVTHPQRSPYRLYALSNAGSMFALLCYPLIVEPALSRRAQAIAWSGVFVVFVLACGYCAIRFGLLKHVEEHAKPVPTRTARGMRTLAVPKQVIIALWVLLPACASMLLLAVTEKLTQDIAPIPFLWIASLSIYLLSFILSFEKPQWYVRKTFILGFVASVWLMVMLVFQEHMLILWQVAIMVFMLFVCCMICHGELFRLRPAASRLTAFYLCIALGGALGGGFVSVAAPLLFTRNLELYIGMFGSIALMLCCALTETDTALQIKANRLRWALLGVVILAGGFVTKLVVRNLEFNTIAASRNFYGTMRVSTGSPKNPDAKFRTLWHGNIRHGVQILEDQLHQWPTMYYGFNSGIGRVMRAYDKTSGRRVGAVGLGIGTLARYGLTDDVYRFYEINPDVQDFASRYFTFLGDSIAKIEIVLGDARLSMEREPPQQYDMLILDAFNGDAIPVHLLTREAFEIYLRHLVPEGVIAVHVSNRYLDLHPVVHRLAVEFKYSTVFLNIPGDDANFVVESHWVIVTKNQALLNHALIKSEGFMPQGVPRVSLWTDDHASLLEVLR